MYVERLVALLSPRVPVGPSRIEIVAEPVGGHVRVACPSTLLPPRGECSARARAVQHGGTPVSASSSPPSSPQLARSALTSSPSPLSPLVIRPGAGVATPGPGDLSTAKIPAAGTAGQIHLREYRCDPGVGPPLHRHSREDEIFWVLEGTLAFFVDGQRHAAQPGTCIFAPRGLAHTFRNTGTTPARIIAIATPGTNSESFTGELGDLMSGPGELQAKMPRMMEVCTRHGIEILGPNPL
jgi:uncharacterized cupin superfamily protein